MATYKGLGWATQVRKKLLAAGVQKEYLEAVIDSIVLGNEITVDQEFPHLFCARINGTNVVVGIFEDAEKAMVPYRDICKLSTQLRMLEG